MRFQGVQQGFGEVHARAWREIGVKLSLHFVGRCMHSPRPDRSRLRAPRRNSIPVQAVKVELSKTGKDSREGG